MGARLMAEPRCRDCGGPTDPRSHPADDCPLMAPIRAARRAT